jgi:ribosomal protein L11 methyltransferase
VATFHVSSFEIDAAGEDTLCGLLWQTRGCLGLEILPGIGGGSRVVAHFDRRPEDSRLAKIGAIAGTARFLGTLPLEDRDWLQPFRAAAQPFEAGQRWLLDPREPDAEPAARAREGRILLRVPARTAFGTGTHESTRLILEWLEELDLRGRVVADLGAGSGILAMAAMRLGARRAIAFDLDVAAAAAVRENGRLNGLTGIAVFAGSSDALADRGLADVALVNVVPEQARPMLPWLSRALRCGGEAVFSGVMLAESAAYAEELERLGFSILAQRRNGEWTALLATRK